MQQKMLFETKLRRTLHQIDLWIHMAVYDEQVKKPVVVEIDKTRSPSDVGNARSTDPRLHRNFQKSFWAKILVERVIFIIEISYGKVEQSVVVIIAPRYAHRSLFDPSAAVACSAFKTSIGERALAFIPEQIIWPGIVSDVEIGPAVVIVITPSRTHPKVFFRIVSFR